MTQWLALLSLLTFGCYSTSAFTSSQKYYNNCRRGNASQLLQAHGRTSFDLQILERKSKREIILQRGMEILSVVTGELLLPLIVSSSGFSPKNNYSNLPIDKTSKRINNEAQQSELWWNQFWQRKSKCSDSLSDAINQQQRSITNAERVCLVLQKLGPTFVKFGQAVSSRGDIIGHDLAYALSSLQDEMQSSFDVSIAKAIIRKELDVDDDEDALELVNTLSNNPVAAASIGQVYSANTTKYGKVAVKIKRPSVQDMVEADTLLFQFLAEVVERLPALPGGTNGEKKKTLIQTDVTGGVEEFMSRVLEELDYKREVENAQLFRSLYGLNIGTARDSLPRLNKGEGAGVIVPEAIPELCTDNIVTMTWIDGEKLATTSVGNGEDREGDLKLLLQGIQCTLSQILETGVMHADPHPGNLLKVKHTSIETGIESERLAYLDFGILATIPEQVRDGLVCAVSQLVFAKDVDAVANLFGELLLLPQEVLDDQVRCSDFAKALSQIAENVLMYDEADNEKVPSLKFDQLLEALVGLVPRFQFQLPPYFLNNARALGTLEGMARSIDPKFNILTIVYPFALKRLLTNPSASPVVERTLYNLVSTTSGEFDGVKATALLNDVSVLTGVKKREIIQDIIATKTGRKFVSQIIGTESVRRLKPKYKSERNGRLFQL